MFFPNCSTSNPEPNKTMMNSKSPILANSSLASINLIRNIIKNGDKEDDDDDILLSDHLALPSSESSDDNLFPLISNNDMILNDDLHDEVENSPKYNPDFLINQPLGQLLDVNNIPINLGNSSSSSSSSVTSNSSNNSISSSILSTTLSSLSKAVNFINQLDSPKKKRKNNTISSLIQEKIKTEKRQRLENESKLVDNSKIFDVSPSLQLKVLCTDDDSDNEENEAHIGDNLTDIYKNLTKSNYLNNNKNINNVRENESASTSDAHQVAFNGVGIKLPCSLTSHVINHSNSDDIDEEEEMDDEDEDSEEIFDNNLMENSFSLLNETGQEVFLNNKKIKLNNSPLSKSKKLKNQVRPILNI